MSEPDSNHPQTPASGQPHPHTPPQAFDLLAFWIQHQKTIVRVFSLIILSALFWIGFHFYKDYQKNAANTALDNAKTVEDYRKVILDHPDTAAAGTAHILLAQQLRTTDKFDDAIQVLRQFIQNYPKHPLAPAAQAALAFTLESADKLDEAIQAYKQVQITNPKSDLAAYSTLAQARIAITQKKPEEAKRLLEELKQQFQGSLFKFEADEILESLKHPNALLTGGTPRPTPPSNPQNTEKTE